MGTCPDDNVSQATVPKIIGVRRDELSMVEDLGALFLGTLSYGVAPERSRDWIYPGCSVRRDTVDNPGGCATRARIDPRSWNTGYKKFRWAHVLALSEFKRGGVGA